MRDRRQEKRKMVMKCELCDRTARMYCESDQASLCWDCDENVHRANFLVAKHSRSLLCHVCQSLTPWKASGAKLGPTVSVCEACVAAKCEARDAGVVGRQTQTVRSDGDVNGDVQDYDDEEDDYDDDDDDDDDEEEEEEIDLEEDDENQVVPWSGESQSPPPVSCSSSSSSSGSEEEVSLKRRRDCADLYSDDEIGCSSSHIGSRAATGNEEANTSTSSFRPLKQPRITTAAEPDDDAQADPRSTAVINSLHRLQKQIITNDGDASATVLAICRMSEDESR